MSHTATAAVSRRLSEAVRHLEFLHSAWLIEVAHPVSAKLRQWAHQRGDPSLWYELQWRVKAFADGCKRTTLMRVHLAQTCERFLHFVRRRVPIFPARPRRTDAEERTPQTRRYISRRLRRLFYSPRFVRAARSGDQDAARIDQVASVTEIGASLHPVQWYISRGACYSECNSLSL